MAHTIKLLLVEDEEELIKIVETYFRDEGYDVRTAFSAEAAISQFSTFTPDVIVSDVKMGEMDGFGFLEVVRKTPSVKDVPLIFLTIMDDRASVERAVKLGASGYMTKPFDVEELHVKINEVLSEKGKR
ncbi:MAG: response regulator [Ignavibacteria bacterium]|nr:response regulator [Ignavibacteria bacterium]